MSSLEGHIGEKRCGFITVEGIDGCGKTTMAKFTTKWLESRGFDAVYTVEPTSTWIGDSVKRGFSEPVGAFTEALLFMADRAEHTSQIRKWVSEGRIVVSDRYVDSTLAYQGASLRMEGIENAVDWLKAASRPYVLVPDMTIFLRIDPALAMKRISGRPKMTKFETAEFLVEVDKVYEGLSRSEERFRIIEAAQPLNKVKSDIVRVLESTI
ncbi:MAG: dTMP kinase [Thermoplasmata archaeon]